MTEAITLATQKLFAELLQCCLDAMSAAASRASAWRAASIATISKKYKARLRVLIWVPVTDKSITDRVSRFAEIKSDFKQRQEMVRALIATVLPTPDRLSGAIVEAMWKAGFFRLRGVLVGTVSFQADAGPLGIKLSGRPLQTQDTDFAQFWGISENIGDSMPAIIEVLKGVDESFEEIPNINDPFVSVAYRNSPGYRVDMLTQADDSAVDDVGLAFEILDASRLLGSPESMSLVLTARAQWSANTLPSAVFGFVVVDMSHSFASGFFTRTSLIRNSLAEPLASKRKFHPHWLTKLASLIFQVFSCHLSSLGIVHQPCTPVYPFVDLWHKPTPASLSGLSRFATIVISRSLVPKGTN